MATTKRSRTSTAKSTTSRSRSTAASKPASRASSAGNGAARKKARAAKTRTAQAATKTARTAASAGKRAQSKASSNGTARSRNGSARTSSARSNGSARSRNGARSTTAQMQDGMVGKLKQTGTAVRQAADKAGRPTITVAAVAGIAGGLALRQRHAATHDGLTTRSMAMLQDVDASALIGGLGKATVQLSQRSKNVARDIERVAEQAERLGKILS
jgi:hypothetical protein